MPMRPGPVFESRSPRAMQGAAVGSVCKASVTGPHRRSRPLPPAISGHAVPRRGRITSAKWLSTHIRFTLVRLGASLEPRCKRPPPRLGVLHKVAK